MNRSPRRALAVAVLVVLAARAAAALPGAVGLSQGDGSQMTLAKFSSTGTLVWDTPTIPGVKTWLGFGGGLAVVVGRSGNAYVTGAAVGGPGIGSTIHTVKPAAADGATKWQKLYSGPQHLSECQAIAIDAHRNTYVIGRTAKTGNNTDWVTRKISPAGKSLWTKRWGGSSLQQALNGCPDPGDDQARPLILDGTTGLFVTGSFETTTGFIDAVLQGYKP